MLELLRKIYIRIMRKNNIRVMPSKQEKLDYINSFDEPRDDIERSYFQYCCQKWDTYGKLEMILANLISAVIYFPYYFYYRHMNRLMLESQKYPYVVTKKTILQGIPDEYADSCIVPDFYCGLLTKEDSFFLKKISGRYPFSFYFRFKIMCRVANYSYIIHHYAPNIIFCTAEYSYTSSVLTMYCEKMGVELDNIMHGEKIFDVQDAFSRFSKFYVWDDFYIGLFLSLRANQTKYVIKPMKVHKVNNVEENPNHYTYYLQDQTLEQLRRIKSKFESMKVNYLVRPHPIYSTDDVKEVFDDEHIESNDIDIWESIKCAGNVVSVFSTVNYQAYLSGVNVVLDDISDPVYFSNLTESDYIMIHKPHRLLSEL